MFYDSGSGSRHEVRQTYKHHCQTHTAGYLYYLFRKSDYLSICLSLVPCQCMCLFFSLNVISISPASWFPLLSSCWQSFQLDVRVLSFICLLRFYVEAECECVRIISFFVIKSFWVVVAKTIGKFDQITIIFVCIRI